MNNNIIEQIGKVDRIYGGEADWKKYQPSINGKVVHSCISCKPGEWIDVIRRLPSGKMVLNKEKNWPVVDRFKDKSVAIHNRHEVEGWDSVQNIEGELRPFYTD